MHSGPFSPTHEGGPFLFHEHAMNNRLDTIILWASVLLIFTVLVYAFRNG